MDRRFDAFRALSEGHPYTVVLTITVHRWCWAFGLFCHTADARSAYATMVAALAGRARLLDLFSRLAGGPGTTVEARIEGPPQAGGGVPTRFEQ